ncbi:glycoside hydrolase family 88 protein [Parafilimonas sp.]|uniref:glycoside hydrolase family 88 protein n=1 Tax=Parafilimonas sp. TaxID=1969739 RepID=UPI0039E28095
MLQQVYKLILLSPFLISAACKSQQLGGKPFLQNAISYNFKDADAQYKVMMKNLPDDKFPKTFQNDTLRTSNSGWWCSGFYPGSLLYIYEQIKDAALYDEAKRMLGLLEKEQFNTATHDLGFMMYCSFGNALRLDPNNEAYKQILINSAKSLASRFNPKVGCIKSWDSKPSDFLVIIDNMMNLELLFWATKATGDSSFYKIAVTHANTTMKNHFRNDYSSYHVVNYDPETGAVQQKKTAQGAADNSAWARGQAWGLYGYTVMYRETKDKKYLEQANHIAHFILANPNLPSDKIPYWDFDAPGIPNAPRDASSAAIIASALLELSTCSKENAGNYVSVAKTIISNLSKPEYKAAIGTNGGFILKHSVGSLPAKSEVDVPLTYGDYYFLEAMTRYKELAVQ